MKWDFCVGNPPYNSEAKNQGDRANPVYDVFMDEAFKIANCVELIHPARFLFNAGQTSKSWNEKMLNDEHFKVLHHEINSSVIFPNTDIKGGVAITIHDNKKIYGAIKIFTSFKELNSITQKVLTVHQNSDYIDSITSSRGLYRFSDEFYKDYPEAHDLVGKGSGNMIISNTFEKMPQILTLSKTDDDMYRILGRLGSKREFRYIKKEYIVSNEFLRTYNVLVPEANGTGAIGEVEATPLIGEPLLGEPDTGVTDTFISIGTFSTKEEAENALKYIKTKFARIMLGVNKITQHNPKSTWANVPIQNFTDKSDIDWSVSISNIDKQFYKKYGLSAEEIEFIEKNIKEMV